jgi:HEAT repeat protein
MLVRVMLAISMMTSALAVVAQPTPSTQPTDLVRRIAPRTPPAADLDYAKAAVTTEDVIPSGLPVLFFVALPNNTAQPLRLLYTGHGRYPAADQFQVRVSQTGRPPRQISPRNGQATQGLMSEVTVAPAESLRVPLAIAPLEPGDYEIELIRGLSRFQPDRNPPQSIATFRVRVVDEDAARKSWIARRTAESRRGDPFAATTCLSFGVNQVIDALLQDLTGDDRAATLTAAGLLGEFCYYLKDSPDRLDVPIATALARHVTDPPPAQGERSVAVAVIRLATRRPNDALLDPLLRASRSDDADARDAAIFALQSYHQRAASDRLVEVLDSPENASHHWIAADALVSRGDKRGLDAMARQATEEDARRSGGRPEFDLLVMYPDVPAARAAVERGLQSSNPDIRGSAERAMNLKSFAVDPLLRQPPPKLVADMTPPDAMRRLLTATEFAVIDEATAADAPPLVIAFRLVEGGGRGSYAAMNHLLADATTAGKLYGLCGLYQQSSPWLKAFADELAATGGEVTVVVGDRSIRMPIRRAVDQVVSGEYPKRLLRLYPAGATTKPTTKPK